MIHGISQANIIQRDENSVVFDSFISTDCDYFDGHFPSFKLLPAVAEFTLAAEAAQQYFAVPAFVSAIKRMKFSAPLLPNTTARFSLKRTGEKISFTIADSADEKKVFSSGTFFVGEKN